eukprot:m.18854 g.18854  ORF g.18854 m.18854 type:complete len:872 (+) comp7954_c0_seq1:697-3312(+)
MEQLVPALQATLGHDNDARQGAQEWLAQAQEHDLSAYVAALATVLRDPSQDAGVRQQAGIQLKNSLTGQHGIVRETEQERWATVPEEVRNAVKEAALVTLGTEESSPSTAAQVVAALAALEMPHNAWPGCVSDLLSITKMEQTTERHVTAVMEALGYLAHDITDIDPALLKDQSTDILSAIIEAASSENAAVQYAAIRALVNSVVFCDSNFAVDEQRDYLMQTVCETTQASDEKVKVAALECLCEISQHYYQYLMPYVGDALYPITTAAMQSENPEAAKQGIEFWTSIAEIEFDLNEMEADSLDKGEPFEEPNFHLCQVALENLLPIVLNSLSKQDEDDDEDDMTVSKAATVCLSYLAETTGDAVVDPTIAFVQENLGSEAWQLRDASVLAFANILSGPNEDKLLDVLKQAVMPLMNLMQDDSDVVKDSIAWALGRMCEVYPEVVLAEDVYPTLMECLAYGLNQAPRVAANVCWSFTNIAEQAFVLARTTEERPASSILSTDFGAVVERLLMEIPKRPDCLESNLMSAAFEAVNQLIQFHPQDCYATVVQTAEAALEQLNQLMESPQELGIEPSTLSQFQSRLCSVLTTSLRVLKEEDIGSYRDNAMGLVLQMLQSDRDQANLTEEALLTVSALIDGLKEDVPKYFDAVKEYVMAAIANTEHYQACFVAVGCISDLARALNTEVAPYVSDIIAQLMQVLTVPNLEHTIKPQILAAFGDIAFAVQGDIIHHLPVVLPGLQVACDQAKDRGDSEDDVEEANELREALIEAYTGVFQALSDENGGLTKELSSIQEHIGVALEFIQYISLDPLLSESCVRCAAGFIGDCVQAFGPAVKQALDQQMLQNLAKIGLASDDGTTQDVLRWMQGLVEQI